MDWRTCKNVQRALSPQQIHIYVKHCPAKQVDTNLVVDHISTCMTFRIPFMLFLFFPWIVGWLGSGWLFWRIVETSIEVCFLSSRRHTSRRIFIPFLYLLPCPINCLLDCSDVDPDLNFAISRVWTPMSFDQVGDIERLSFTMTDPDYLIIPRMHDHDSAFVTHCLSPCLDACQDQYFKWLITYSLCHLLK